MMVRLLSGGDPALRATTLDTPAAPVVGDEIEVDGVTWRVARRRIVATVTPIGHAASVVEITLAREATS